MSEQIDLFFSATDRVIPVASGWFIAPSKKSTVVNQSLYFDLSGIPSTYYAGQKSEWVLNGIEKSAFYADGDPDRIPSKAIIDQASDLLIKLTNAGELFPETLERVIYYHAWEKGANAGFENMPEVNNPYDFGSPEFKAWSDGWLDNSSTYDE